MVPGTGDSAGFGEARPVEVVREDIACRRCGYNLRGLGEGGQCPECGAPVTMSIQGDLLRYADPRWLAGRWRATRIVVWGQVSTFLLASQVDPGETSLFALVPMLGAMVRYWGGWQVTVADPVGSERGGLRAYRWTVRVGLAIPIVWSVVRYFVRVLSFPPIVGTVCFRLGPVVSLIGAVALFAELSYLAGLVERIPDGARVRGLRIWRWAVAGASFVNNSSWSLYSGALASGGLSMVLIAVLSVTHLITLVVIGIPYLVIVWRVGTALREQAAKARGRWATAARPVQSGSV